MWTHKRGKEREACAPPCPKPVLNRSPKVLRRPTCLGSDQNLRGTDITAQYVRQEVSKQEVNVTLNNIMRTQKKLHIVKSQVSLTATIKCNNYHKP